MGLNSYEEITRELRRDFPEESVVRREIPPNQVAFVVSNVPTPTGSSPAHIQVLVLFSAPSQPAEVLVDPLPTLSNGTPCPNPKPPRQIDGKVWQDYSVQWSWDPSLSIWANVRRKLMRFAATQ